MASEPSPVPAERTAGHLLVVPAATGPAELAGLAAAWFDDAGWLTPPPAPAVPPPPSLGARLRGLRRPPEPAPGPAVLRLGGEHRATGPSEVGPAGSGAHGVVAPAAAWVLDRLDGQPDVRGPRPATYDDPDGIARTFAAGLPTRAELEVVRWAVAVARRAGGALLADGREPLRPDPSSGVDLTLWTSRVLTPADLLAAVRTLVATARPAQDGSVGADYRVVAATPYDGATVVDVVRAEGWPRPVVGEQGRAVAYRVRWAPQDAEELLVERPSGVHLIARARTRVLHARLAQELCRRVGGTVVDDDGFVVTPQALDARLAEVPGARAWV